MFESHVLFLLRRYLGEYVNGLSAEALKISVWKGDVVLKNLTLKAEALNSLNLPITVKAGFVGTITLKVPWKNLGKEPVIVLIDRVFVLANPAPDGWALKDVDKESLLEAKLLQIEEAESATLEAKSKSSDENPKSGNSWFGSLISTIIGNLKISITNVHVRYEDSLSNPGCPFSLGVTLAKLAAVTTDETGKETFDTSGVLDKLRKTLQLERLSFYHDSNITPWKKGTRWEDLSPKEWIEIFEEGISEPLDHKQNSQIWSLNRKYVVSPINGTLKYHRLGKQERNDPEVPHEKASLVITDVSVTVSELQYRDWVKLYDCFSKYKIYVENSHLRPKVDISHSAHLWWCYAAQASLEPKKICYRLSWDQIKHMCQLRRHYIMLYANLLQLVPNANTSEIREIERDLDSKVILLWRLLAHAKVETGKLKQAAEQRRNKKNSWFSFGRYSLEDDASVGNLAENSQLAQGEFTKEEWNAINKLLSYQPDNDDTNLLSEEDAKNGIRYLITISIEKAAVRIVSYNETEILCGRFTELLTSGKFRHHSTECDLSLRYYGLSSLEGSLCESINNDKKVNALAANFVYSPIKDNVDWKLSTKISPCHITLSMESYDRFMEFIKRSKSFSPDIAMETATALQIKFDKATRRAQDKIQLVLEEHTRFSLDIDFDAPKVRIPIQTGASSQCSSYFLIDFGHFTLVTKECNTSDPGHDLYSRFCLSGRDISAYFADYDNQNSTFNNPTGSAHFELSLQGSNDNFYPLIDRCGLAVIVDQINAPHPRYPSTCISVQIPNLGIHFSPARYSRLMQLVNMLCGTLETDQPNGDTFDFDLAPWRSADLVGCVRILVWKGIGNSVAAWQPCYLALSGFYLYVLESEQSVSYQRCLRLAGRKVFEALPASVDNSNLCVAVCFCGINIQKALESSSTLVIEFQSMAEKSHWMKGLVHAINKASAIGTENLPERSPQNVQSIIDPKASIKRTADLVMNMALIETKLSVYGKIGDGGTPDKDEEILILEVLAGGGKVHLNRLEGDLTINSKLHYLKIMDMLQGKLSNHHYYLAYSVPKSSYTKESRISDELQEKITPSLHEEDYDMFADASPDFTCLPDQVASLPHMDNKPSNRTEYDNELSLIEAAEALICENGSRIGPFGAIVYEALQNENNLDFLSLLFSTRSPDSPDYDGIDTQMSIRISKLEFVFHRPTLLALISFGIDLSSVNSRLGNDKVAPAVVESVLNKESGCVYIKGLLGKGKKRVVFNLHVDVESVSVSLNKEDGSQLATFVQEVFRLELKVYPCSLSIYGTLGDFKLRDLSSGVDPCWSCLSEIWNPGVDSLIKFTFSSYNPDDDDYEGYDYGLCGHLSAVRIVFLYRFVQEITAYFMELATPHTEEAIKLVNKVGGPEWLIQKSEVEGSLALKLDLYLDAPVIIIPKSSNSKKFIQVDFGQLRVTNNLSQHGNCEEDHSAVHVDVIHVKISGISMCVGDGDSFGKPMIQGGHGFDVYVRRSLVDIFKKVPTVSIDVKVSQLHTVLSDKDYNTMIECSSTNFGEVPNLPPSFRRTLSDSKGAIKLLADQININSQVLLSRNVTVVGFEVDYALLELCNGTNAESPLAHFTLEGLWVSYRMTSTSEIEIHANVPKLSIVDSRPNTKQEMRLMLGSATDFSKTSGSCPPSLGKRAPTGTSSENSSNDVAPVLTMFAVDFQRQISSQSLVLRIQQPRVLVVPGFLIDVGEFFMPALGSITGTEENADPDKDPISGNNCTILSEPVYKQTAHIVHFSHTRQLIVDAPDIDEYTYDGCGKTICLGVEADFKVNNHSQVLRPIIIIGRGKTLKFRNVKIESGSLLREHTYLSTGSSYTVSPEDGVHIVHLDSSYTCNKTSVRYNETSRSSATSPDILNKVQSFSFDAQIVSLQFTFYDGTNSSLDGFMDREKLLRAQMDINFMYVSKENDTWIRAILKDLMVESGLGLVVLDPVDISGGYTSVKDKTSISLMSTDIIINLSLSMIYLILNLQKQTCGALQFRSVSPVLRCTNFEQIWVSPKRGLHNNLTFWRPKAPSNYVILGDCVTSRSIPPSEAVVAIRNMYGRVKRPLGFTLMGCFSDILLIEGDNNDLSPECQCSIWWPNAPPGYVSLGSVVHLGREPPPNHIVYCLRSDLVASCYFSECVLNLTSNSKFMSGFSLWRCDNVVGSFVAHPSAEYPHKQYCYDLNYRLLWYSASMPNKFVSETTNRKHVLKQDSEQNPNSSGWDMLRSISRTSNCYKSTPNMERIWWDKGSELRQPISIWRPIAGQGYAILGDCITGGIEPPALGIIFMASSSEIAAQPVEFTKVGHITGKGLDDVFIWYPIAPPGYASVGCIVSRTDKPPQADIVCCPRLDLLNPGKIVESPILASENIKSPHCWSIWKVENQAGTFFARADLKKPSSRLAYTIVDSIKPKTRDNITSEMELRCFSLTIFDGLRGMMTPLVNATITGVKVASHGRMEAMNAVIVSSIAASTFNAQVEAWEPLIEPVDWIFKFETYDTEVTRLSGTGKRVRVSTTGILNLNISAANLKNLGDTVVSWRRQMELEVQEVRLDEKEIGALGMHGDDSTVSALEENEFKSVTIENVLGCELYVKKVEQNTDSVEVLQHGTRSSVSMTSPGFSNRVNTVHQLREARHYVAITILETKNLQMVSDAINHNFFCTLRLVVDGQTSDQQKLYPQSARTKGVKPMSSDVDFGIAKWNELFIFETPTKDSSVLEVEVTNLAAKAGKGEVAGSFSISLGHGASALKKVASSRVLNQVNVLENAVSYRLMRQGQLESNEEPLNHSSMSMCTIYFEKNLSDSFQEHQSESAMKKDVQCSIGLSAEGPWENFDLLFPLSVIPKFIQDEFVALEVVMKNGKKHAILRSLVSVVNDSDVKLDILVCSYSAIQTQDDLSKSKNSDQNSSASQGFLVTLYPGSSCNVPWKLLVKGSKQCLQVRPNADLQPPWPWCYTMAMGSSDALREAQLILERPPSRQDTTKQANKFRNYLFELDQLEKKDMLLCSSAEHKTEQFWLSSGTDVSVLSSELNEPIYDWKISLSSPLRLENRLPCPAEFTIWEKTKDRVSIQRQRGIISSRKSVHVYAVDVQKSVYLTFCIHGGWVLETDPVLILDLMSNDQASSFWMVHQQSKRKLRVSIERDMGGNGAAPKTITFFVPYWIVNDSSLLLAYKLVEIEPLDNADIDSIFLSQAKSPKKENSSQKGHLGERKNIQVLEVIEDTSPMPSMLSPNNYASRRGGMLFPSRSDAYLSPRVGISVAVGPSENFSPGISLLELENKERVDVKAFKSDGSYYNLTALLKITSDRTKVINFWPRVLFINRVGVGICLRQCGTSSVEWVQPSDPPKSFAWPSSAKSEQLQLRVEGHEWSSPFSVSAEGLICVYLKNDSGRERLYLKVEVRSATKWCSYEVIMRPDSFSSPYRIENRSASVPVRFRQVDGSSESWQTILPSAATGFTWEDLGRQRLLEILADRVHPSNSNTYNIDEVCDHLPTHEYGGPERALNIAVGKEDKINVIKISDWVPENEPSTGKFSSDNQNDILDQQSPATSICEFHFTVEIAELGLSVIDHTPEEILYLSIQNLLVSRSVGLGSGISRFKLRMRGIQVDNQLPFSTMPVLFRPQRVGDEDADTVLNFSMTMQSDGSSDLCVYPYIGLQGSASAFLINIHEPLIWRLHEMIQQANMRRIYDDKKTAVSVDPSIQIRILHVSEIRLKVSTSMSPAQRPRGVLGFWSSLMTSLGNIENMQVRINQRDHENLSMRRSVMTSNALSNIQKDLLSQPLQLLSGVDILGNASSALGNMSQGVAALSMDEKFLQSRRRQENKGAGDVGDVIREGGGAFAKGLFRGVTGILTKPFEGAKSAGVEGFVQGVGKGIIGAAAQPVSGALDLLSKTTEGANAMRMKIMAAITSEEQLLRRRLPRVIGGDNLLRPYDEYKAQGQVILQLAESGSFLNQVDLFKVRCKFALSDAYENHFLLRKTKILIITHRRILLLQEPANNSQRKFSPARDPCSVLWDVTWDSLASMKLSHGKKDLPNSPHSRLTLHLHSNSTGNRDQFQIIKCTRETSQATEVYTAIEQALNSYEPNKSKGKLKGKVTTPYRCPTDDSLAPEGILKEQSAA